MSESSWSVLKDAREQVYLSLTLGQRTEDLTSTPYELANAASRLGWVVNPGPAHKALLQQWQDHGVGQAKATLRSEIIQYWKKTFGSSTYDLKDLNGLLTALGMDKYSGKWIVTVIIDDEEFCDVIVEADNESIAEARVLESMSPTKSEISIPFTFEGDGIETKRASFDLDIDRWFEGTEVTCTVSEYTE